MTNENPVIPGTVEAVRNFNPIRLTNSAYDEPDLEADKKSGRQTHDLMWTHASDAKRREMILDYFEYRNQICTEDIVQAGITKRYVELNDRFKKYLRIRCIDEIVKTVR